ncbi:MAG: CYTH domain-containing protein [Flavobacteriaceae bacterium]
MAGETERKFLVASDGWMPAVERRLAIRQFYLSRSGSASVRVRIVGGERALLTIKSARAATRRAEFEYAIPLADAEALEALKTGATIEKIRHVLPAGGGLDWEIDVFSGAHEGLVIAEIELPEEDSAFERPAWLGREVSGDRDYYNSTLAAAG